MAIIPNGRRQHQPQQQSSWSFSTFTIGFFVGLLCFAIMTFYISDQSIQHMTTMSTTTSNSGQYNFLDVISSQQSQSSLTAKGSSDLNDNALAGLSCNAYGGPSDEHAKEMVYWQDIPSDR
jgi:hypothetical protein